MSNNLNQGASEAERELFEAFAKDHFGCSEFSFARAYEQGYFNAVHSNTFGGRKQAEWAPVSMLWDTWQAARRTPAATTGTEPSATAWEQRALEAERNLEGALRALGAENGATFMGEPVLANRASPSIDAMVERFLGWPLPKDFSPDCGISFDGRGPDARGYDRGWPTGTNLLAATQVKAMLEYVLAAPASAQPADSDLEARNKVTRALGLDISYRASFAWSYLLGVIEDLVKFAEDAEEAGAQPNQRESAAVPDEVMKVGGRMAAWLYGLSRAALPFQSWACKCKELAQEWDEVAAAPSSVDEHAKVERDMQEIADIWDAAKAEAAMYVEAHCVDGEIHANAIMSQARPVIRPARQDSANNGAEGAS